MIALFYEDIEIGAVISLGSCAFTRESVLAFARKYDPQPFHIDDAAAAASHFGRIPASGWHTAACWMKCYIATLQAALATLPDEQRSHAGQRASPGFTALRWPKPVYPGDTIAYTTSHTSKRLLASRPGWGFAQAHNEGRNQDGELVYSFESKVFMPCR